MKKIICILISLLLLMSLCACNFDFLDQSGDSLKEVKNYLQQITDNNIIKANDENVARLTPTELSPKLEELTSCYNVLNSKQKNMYRIFLSAADEMPEGFVDLGVNDNDSEYNLMLSYRAFLNDFPQIFWMPNTYVSGTNDVGGKINTIVAFNYEKDELNVTYTVEKTQRDEMRITLENTVSSIITESEKYDSQFEKEKFFNDFIADNTTYDLNATLGNSSFGCLVNKSALCEGYSRAFQLLCQTAGIKCDLVTGVSENQGHMWNCVNIDGSWTYVDVTWNDTDDQISYAYFNLTENQLIKDHFFAALVTEVEEDSPAFEDGFNFVKRECGSDRNNYFLKTGAVFDFDYKQIAGIINDFDKQGQKQAEFMFTDDSKIIEFNKKEKYYLQKIQDSLPKINLTSYRVMRNIITVYWK